VPEPRPSRILQGFGWSAAYMVATRASTFLAVPLVLGGVGPRLYAVWVLACSLVSIQSLFDFGVASALVRFVAQAAASDSRKAVIVITRRALAFYVLLSVVVAVPMWLFAGPFADLIPFLRSDEHRAAVVIVHWSVIAFGLTNITLVLATTLQGIDRVGPSYRDQTVGWMLYLPVLIAGLQLGSHAQAVGAAWVGAYAVQLLLLTRTLVVNVRKVPSGDASPPTSREMLSFGGRWQISAWADFATFQVPRFVASFGLTAADALAIDVAIRAGQLAVAPLFAFYPTVVPHATALFTRDGLDGMRRFLAPYYSRGVLVLIAGTCFCLALEIPALAAWTGRPPGSFEPLVPGLILIGSVAHASTGLFSSAYIARGDVRSIISYKLAQLLAAAVLMSVAAPFGAVPLAAALGAALTVPAIGFNLRARRAFGIDPALTDPRTRLRLVAGGALQVAIPAILIWRLARSMSAGPLLAMGIAVSVLTAAALFGSQRRSARRPAQRLETGAGSEPALVDHFARK
jgi:O-antigen/teichoic acid export membrane protein